MVLDRLGRLARNVGMAPDIHRWYAPLGHTATRPTLPKSISTCLPAVTSFCSGTRNVQVQGGTLDKVHYVFVGATLEDFDSWPVVKGLRRAHRKAFTEPDEPDWRAMLTQITHAETANLRSKFSDKFKAWTLENLAQMPQDQRLELRNHRIEWIQKGPSAGETLSIPVRAGNDNVSSHIVQAFEDKGDLDGMLFEIQACLSCKLSLGQDEAMQVTHAHLAGMLDRFTPAARDKRATSCAEVIMTQYCVRAGTKNRPTP